MLLLRRMSIWLITPILQEKSNGEKMSLGGSTFPPSPYLRRLLMGSHSHPGYGCWLSGIDVSTQLQNQQFQDPWVAVVVPTTPPPTTLSLAVGADGVLD